LIKTLNKSKKQCATPCQKLKIFEHYQEHKVLEALKCGVCDRHLFLGCSKPRKTFMVFLVQKIFYFFGIDNYLLATLHNKLWSYQF